MSLSLPFVLPLAGTAITLAYRNRPRVQRVTGVVALTICLVISASLLHRVRDGAIETARVGGWEPPFGIVFAVDPLSALMLVVSFTMLLTVLLYAIGTRKEDEIPGFHPIYLVLASGIALSFLTADLFNLFVAFELTLVSSYVLLTLGGRRSQMRHGMTYVVINLLASTLFVTAVGFVYAATGSVNMAEVAVRIQEIDPHIRTALGLLFVVVFGIKAAIFPLFFWLPDAYPTAPAPITAIFAGLLTKVGVYAIIRSQTLLFAPDGPSHLLLYVAGATMLVGVLGAIAQNDVKRILSFHIVSQIGYMVFGLALFTVAGLAATVVYIVHHILVKTALFLVSGLIENRTGTGALNRMGGLLHTSPAVAALFVVPAFSLAGLPPFSGFLAKLALVQAGLAVEAHLVVGVSLLVSLLTLFSMLKIWAGAFWGEREEAGDTRARREAPRDRLMTASTAGLVLIGVALVAVAGPLYQIGQNAGEILADSSRYIAAVLR